MSDENKIPIRRPLSQAEPARPAEQPTYSTDIISLPTHGWFYPEGHPLSSGEVEVKQMTAREEDILANQELIRKGKVLDRLLQSVVINKEIDPRDMLTPDKNALFIGIRRLAYGDKYSVRVTCPVCAERSDVDIDLGQLKNKEIDIESFPRGKNSFPFTLPKSGVNVTYKILNQHDDDEIEKELTGLRKISRDNVPEVTTRLKYIITSVNGVEDKEAIRKFVSDELLAVDSRALREHIRNNTPDVDLKFDFKCSACGIERRSDVPMGASFLWPDIEA